jgi:hypothetical protein
MSGRPVRRAPRFVYLCDAKDQNDPAARFGWRLIAANNRALGRAVRVDVSLEQCVGSAERVHREVAESSTSVQFNPVRGHWSWQVVLGGATVAVCVHPYLRRVECVRALEQFLAAVTAACPAEGVVKHFGPRSLRSYDVELTATGTGS